MEMVSQLLGALGRGVGLFVREVGEMGLLAQRTGRQIPRMRTEPVAIQMIRFGIRAIPIVALVTLPIWGLLSIDAWAQPQLVYLAPSGYDCPSEDDVRLALVRRVEPLPGGRDERIVAVRVEHIAEVNPETTEESNEPFILEITLEGPDAAPDRPA